MAKEKPLIFRFNENGPGPEVVTQVLLERGWVEFNEDTHDEDEWNFWWKTGRFRVSDYEHLQPWQRLNHYPKTTALTRKDNLARNLKRMKCIYGASLYNFIPLCYNLPNEYKKFVADYTKRKQTDPEKMQPWICKPADMSRGRGIFIFRDLSELQYDCSAVLQKYITNPLLIAGYKFDLRIYVCVASFHPLGIYVYQEGIVRFSTEKFDLTTLSNVYSHLTNTSINKYGPSYMTDKERVGPGCKWTVTQLRHYFHQNEIDDRLLWCKVTSLVILTILAQADQVPKETNCFELYGFDIIIDDNLKPWLLEVNFSPALGIDCSTDVVSKKPMLHDLIDMLKYSATDCEQGREKLNVSSVRKHIDSQHQATRRSNAGKTKRKPDKIAKSKVSNSEDASLKEVEDDDEGHVELVPGCGLPSVQMPKGKSCQSADSSSGCSSIGSFNSSTRSQADQAKNTEQSDARVNGFSEVKDNPAATDNKISESHFVKEISTVSDSAVSGLSSSENSDLSAEIDPVAQVKLTQDEQGVLSKSCAVMRSCYDKHKSSSSSKSMVNTNWAVKIPSRQNGLLQPLHNGVSTAGMPRKLSEPAPQINRPPLLVRNNTQPTGLSPSRNGEGPKNAPFLQRKKVPNGLAPAAGLATTRKSFSSTNNSKFGPLATGVSKSESNSTYPVLEERFGDYFLVYPFNEQTRRMGSKLDIRVAVREVQTMLKAKTDELNGTGEVGKVCDRQEIWAPLWTPDTPGENKQAKDTPGMFGFLNMKSQD